METCSIRPGRFENPQSCTSPRSHCLELAALRRWVMLHFSHPDSSGRVSQRCGAVRDAHAINKLLMHERQPAGGPYEPHEVCRTLVSYAYRATALGVPQSSAAMVD